MNQKFGGAKKPVGTPSMALSSAIVIVSLLGGASIVHSVYNPDLTLPLVKTGDAETKIEQPARKD